MTTRRVLLVLPWGLRQLGGVNEVVRRLATSLRASPGWDARVLVTREADRIDRVTTEALPVEYLALAGPFDGRSRFKAMLSFVRRLPDRLGRLEAALRRDDVRVVNVHYPSLAALHFVFLRMLGRWPHALVLSFHLSDAVQAAETRGLERWCWRFLLRHADRIVTPTRDLAVHLLAIAPDVEPRIVAVPNGVDVSQFDEPATSDAAAGAETSPAVVIPPAWSGRPLLLSVGGLLPRKGHADVLAALARLKAAGRTATLVVIGGDAPYRAELEQQRHALGLDDDVRILADVPHAQIPAWLRAATLFVLATRAETFCIAILEAGAARVPVVSTRAPGVVEVVEDGVTARLCGIGDVPALERTIAELLDHPEQGRTLAAALRARIEHGLTWAHHGARYREVLAG
ncbi:MAG: glycosyltransferase family 4 protein [Gemmatimonadetes bacterium]|nr:glycosyltransferase family 4 protein [Gemmatimonadota bacterium]